MPMSHVVTEGTEAYHLAALRGCLATSLQVTQWLRWREEEGQHSEEGVGGGVGSGWGILGGLKWL